MPFSFIMERTSSPYQQLPSKFAHANLRLLLPQTMSSPGNRFQLLRKAFCGHSLWLILSLWVSLLIKRFFKVFFSNTYGDFPQQKSDGINLHHFTSEFKDQGRSLRDGKISEGYKEKIKKKLDLDTGVDLAWRCYFLNFQAIHMLILSK